MTPPESIALTFCEGCGRTGLLLHAIAQFRERSACAYCRDQTIQVAIYRFERVGTALSGNLLTEGARPAAAPAPAVTRKKKALP